MWSVCFHLILGNEPHIIGVGSWLRVRVEFVSSLGSRSIVGVRAVWLHFKGGRLLVVNEVWSLYLLSQSFTIFYDWSTMNHSVSSMPLVCFHIKLSRTAHIDGLGPPGGRSRGNRQDSFTRCFNCCTCARIIQSSSMNGFWRFSKHVGPMKSMPIFPDASVSYSWILGHECVCLMALCSARVSLFKKKQLETGTLRSFYWFWHSELAPMLWFCKSSGRVWLFERSILPHNKHIKDTNHLWSVGCHLILGNEPHIIGAGSWLRVRIFLGLEVL